MKYFHILLSIVALAVSVILLVMEPWRDGDAPQGGQRDPLVPDIPATIGPAERTR